MTTFFEEKIILKVVADQDACDLGKMNRLPFKVTLMPRRPMLTPIVAVMSSPMPALYLVGVEVIVDTSHVMAKFDTEM